MDGSEKLNATVLSFALIVSLIAAVTLFGAAVGTVGAVHPSDAPDMTDQADFRVNFPSAEDHYPGREEQGSIQYFASGADAFAAQDAEEGVYIDWIIVHAEYEGEDWIDYSACDTENTGAFGIDRGNDNEGTNYDQDLIQHRKDDEFRDDGIVIEFYDWSDIPENPPYLAPEDAIVASQGSGSAAGPCLTITETPGWYRIAGFMNGTTADNGPDEQPSENAERVSLELNSNYLYVCECDSEEEARDELGPPPNEDGGDDGSADDGSTDDGSSDDGSGDDDSTDDGSSDDGTSEDDGSTDDGSAGDGSTDDGSSEDDGSTDDGSAGDGSTDDGSSEDDGSTDDGSADDDSTGGTPAADGPGFGALAALVALLAAALLATRRRD